MAEAVISAFVQAKFHNIDASVALYFVSDDLEGKRIARTMHSRAIKAMTAMLETAPGRQSRLQTGRRNSAQRHGRSQPRHA